MSDKLHIDFETFSELNLTKVGTSRYARHPSTEVLMCAYAVNDGPVSQWVPAEGEQMSRELDEAIRDPDVLKIAWNKPFEWCIWTHVLGVETPHEAWRCAMVLAYTLSLPGKLEAAGEVVDLPSDKKKMARGKALMRRFTNPRKPTKTKPWARATHETDPVEWEEFKVYNKQDVEAERAIWNRLKRWQLPADEWRLWVLDQKINEAGIPIRMSAVHNAIRVSREIVQARLAEMAEITGLDNPNSGVQLLEWLGGQGYPFLDLKKGHVAQALDIERRETKQYTDYFGRPFPQTTYARVLELRKETSKASVKKYNALAEATDEDGRIRYQFQFAAAGRTWRWGGRQYQPHNLARPVWYLEDCQTEAARDLEYLDAEAIQLLYDKPMDLLSTCGRCMAQAESGDMFAVADLNAIENRVLGWLANDQKILGVFRAGRDPYIDFATYMFQQPYGVLWREYEDGKKGRRQLAKPPVLGCGYMLSAGEEHENHQTGEFEATGLLGYARMMGVEMTPEQAKHAVDVWRATFTDAVAYWKQIDLAARKCIRTGQPQRARHIRFDRSGPFMRMILPSGRPLHYCRPRLEQTMMPWGQRRLSITYEGLNQQKQWVRLPTHPGKLTENADQAVARDILAHGMRLADHRGLDIRLHVHDEIVVRTPKRKAEKALEILQECMKVTPVWAKGLPLDTNGFISRVYIKG